MQNIISYLILDYNKPNESEICLKSIIQNTRFNYQIIYLSNGGNQDYVLEFYKNGLIDKLILNKENNGLGFGTQDLFRFCDTKYAIYFQNDQYLGREFSRDELDYLISILESQDNIKSIGLAGNTNNGKYSERAHLINVDFYNQIEGKLGGGAGPYAHIEWNESIIHKYYEKNEYKHFIYDRPLVGDNGMYGVRENPDKSIWKHRTDTKKTWLIGGKVAEKYEYPPFSDETWDKIIKEQKCDGLVPEGWSDHVFQCWKD